MDEILCTRNNAAHTGGLCDLGEVFDLVMIYCYQQL